MTGSMLEQLKEEPWHYSLIQAINLIEGQEPGTPPVGSFKNPRDERVRIRNTASLKYPASELTAITSPTEDEPYYVVETTDIGLYGILSPLPIHYTSDLLSSQAEDEEPAERRRRFLDIFGHRLFSLQVAIDRLLDLQRHGLSDSLTDFERFLLRTVHLPLPYDEITRQRSGLVNNAGVAALFYGGTRTAADLVRWLNVHFPDVPIAVIENAPRWRDIPADERCALGSHRAILGGAGTDAVAMLGTTLLDQETHVGVQLGLLSWETFVRFLPGTAEAASLCQLTAVFLPDYLDFEVVVLLNGPDCLFLRTRLDETARLGLTSGLFVEKGAEYPFPVHIPAEETARLSRRVSAGYSSGVREGAMA